MLRPLLALFALLLPIAAFSGDFPQEKTETGLTWFTDFTIAKEQAKAAEKPLFVLFTGSDWCGWCKRLDGEALSTNDFSNRVSDKFIFAKIDFPMKKAQSAALRAQNENLKVQYGIRGFPTVVLFDHEMRKIAQTGYEPGGGAQYAEHLLKLADEHQEMRGKMATLDQKNATAEELTELFEMTRRLGEEDYQDVIITAGVERKIPYFLIEKYQKLQQDEAEEAELAALREEILTDGDREAHYRLAILDYVQNSISGTTEATPETIAAPLLDYLQRFGDNDQKNSWRVQLQVATLYQNAGEDEKATDFLEKALKNAPDTHREEVQAALDTLKTPTTL